MISNNLTSETNLINASSVESFSEGLPQYELDKNAQKIRSLGLENDERCPTIGKIYQRNR